MGLPNLFLTVLMVWPTYNGFHGQDKQYDKLCGAILIVIQILSFALGGKFFLAMLDILASKAIQLSALEHPFDGQGEGWM